MLGGSPNNRVQRSSSSRVSFDEEERPGPSRPVYESADSVNFGLLRAGGIYETEVDFGEGRRVLDTCPSDPELLACSCPGAQSKLLVRLSGAREGRLNTALAVRLASEDGTQQQVDIPVTGNVMHRSKGTPQLRPSVRCVGHTLQEETDASDWAGFD